MQIYRNGFEWSRVKRRLPRFLVSWLEPFQSMHSRLFTEATDLEQKSKRTDESLERGYYLESSSGMAGPRDGRGAVYRVELVLSHLLVHSSLSSLWLVASTGISRGV